MKSLFFISICLLMFLSGCTSRFGKNGEAQLASAFTPGPAAQIVFSLEPTDGVASSPIPIKVTVMDSNGRVSPVSIPIMIAFADINGNQQSLTAQSFKGVAEFNGFSVATAGTGYTVTASTAGLRSVDSTPFNVSPSSEAALSFEVQPLDIFAGAIFPSNIAVAVRDATGNLVTSSSAMVTLTISAGGVLIGTQTAQAVNGLATFVGTSSTKVGTGFTLSATSGVLQPSVSAPFNVTPAAGEVVVFLANPTDAKIGMPFSTPVVVELLDTYGNVATQEVTPITLTAYDNGAPTAMTFTITPTNGIAMTTNNFITVKGNAYTLVATSDDDTPATSTPFKITP